MKRKSENNWSLERRIARQEQAIPVIAKREFRKAFECAIESGARVLIGKNGYLMCVSKADGEVLIRPLSGVFGGFPRGTRLRIKSSEND